MKAFAVAVLFVLASAVAAGFVLEGAVSQRADDAFATQSVRVGEGGAIGSRHFDGR